MLKKVIRTIAIAFAAALLAALFIAAGAKETKAQPLEGKNFVHYVPYGYTGFALDDKGTWYFFRNGRINWGYYGLAQGLDGDWYFSNGGYIDWNVTGLAFNQYGWFYVDHGKVNWGANTLCHNQYGWWKVTNGVVDFGFNGFWPYNNNWFYLRNGCIDWRYYGLAQGWDGRWYFVNGGYIDWKVTGTAFYNGQNWKVEKGVVTGLATSNAYNTDVQKTGAGTDFARGGKKYLRDYFGISREQFVGYMMKVEKDHNYNYYLNTPFRGLGYWKYAHNLFYTKAHPRADGFAAMNCGSFVAVATRDAGCNLKSVYPYSELKGDAAYIGLAKASAWYNFATASNIVWRGYNSKKDLLADGWATRGDIIYCRPDYEHGAKGDVHVGFYWGGAPGEDYMWHSITYKYLDQYGNRLGNTISHITAPSIGKWYVFKWDAS